MNPADRIADELAALSPKVCKPWLQLDRLPYLHATNDPHAKPYDTPVVGRFDYLPTMAYIQACNPSAMRAVLEERQQLRTALQSARRRIQMDRNSLHACHLNPRTGAVDADGAQGLAEYDHVLTKIEAALNPPPQPA